MWRANKVGMMVLALGLALLAILHYVLTPHSELWADRVLALGFCLLLFGVGLASWLSVKSPVAAEEEQDAAAENDEDSLSR